ncbi:MAG: hypothetical protein V3V63_04745 [Candidatus Hydrothermarchaeaceae archaeon]
MVTVFRDVNPAEIFGMAQAAPASTVEKIKSICSFCAVGCGYVGVVEDGVFTKMEPWEVHPMVDVANPLRRLKGA